MDVIYEIKLSLMDCLYVTITEHKIIKSSENAILYGKGMGKIIRKNHLNRIFNEFRSKKIITKDKRKIDRLIESAKEKLLSEIDSKIEDLKNDKDKIINRCIIVE